jgi:DNA-binding transcriptional ArsR family regulator
MFDTYRIRATGTSMVELATQQSKVRDLTESRRRIPIEVDGAGSYEVLLAMWTAFSPEEGQTAFDLGPEWITSVREATPEDVAAEILALGGPGCAAWLSLLGLVATAPHPHDPDRVFDWLGQLNPQRLRRWMLGYLGHFADPAVVEEAAEGDIDAVRQIVGEHKEPEVVEQIVALFEIPPEEIRDRMAGTIKRFRSEVFKKYEDDFYPAIDRAAAAQRATSSREDAKKVIEDVTNGVDYGIPLGVTRVILIPSVVLKPFSVIDQHRESLLVLYGMADEFIDSDPEAPPSWLVKTYKALSDERRLRILRRLSESETTLDELTDLLGLSKSTVHHHISVLRGAGLIRVHISRNKDTKEASTYALRTQALTNAGEFLDTYVRTDHPAASNE